MAVKNSALFINGVKAIKNYVYITPFVDFSEKLKNKDKINHCLMKRKSKYDLVKAEHLWKFYKDLNKEKNDIIENKSVLSQKLTQLMADNSQSNSINALKLQCEVLKDNLKKLKKPLWSAEEAAMIEALKLPNSLHPLTEDKCKILFSHLSIPSCNIELSNIINKLVVFKENKVFLKGDAATFELGAQFYFSSVFKSYNLIQFSNPDFVKSVIVEGCGTDHTDANSSFILQHNEESDVSINNRLHLTGGASEYAFFAYYAKNVLYPKVFPLEHFSIGRQYKPQSLNPNNLYCANQSTVLNLFGAAKDENQLNSVLDKWMDVLKESFLKLNYHFRISIAAAENLHYWESLRIVLEMYSTSLNSYIEVASISVSGDFLSKRLMFTYLDNKVQKFPHVISGTVNIHKLLGCVLEQSEHFEIPILFSVENW